MESQYESESGHSESPATAAVTPGAIATPAKPGVKHGGSRRLGVAKGLAALTTLFIAIWGAYTGTVSWLDARQQVVNLSVDGSATLNHGAIDLGGVVLGVANGSQHSLFIRHAELRYHGKALVDVSLTDADSGGGGWQYLPVAVPSNGAMHFGLALSNVPRRMSDLVIVWERRVPQRVLTEPWMPNFQPVPIQGADVELALDFGDAGWRTVALHVGALPLGAIPNNPTGFVGRWNGATDSRISGVMVTIP
jgi:hypothetical protein